MDILTGQMAVRPPNGTVRLINVKYTVKMASHEHAVSGRQIRNPHDALLM